MEHGEQHAEGYNLAKEIWSAGATADPMELVNPYQYGTERWHGFEEAVADLCDQLEA